MVGKINANKYFATECSVLFFKLSICRQKLTVLGRSGFTLVELIVVVAILGILATMSIPTYSGYMKSIKNKTCVTDLRTIEKAITGYILDKNTLPSSATALSDIGLGSLFDPWKRPYVYKNLSDVGALPLKDTPVSFMNKDYDLYSMGENGASIPAFGGPANADDVVRSNDGGFVGERSEL